MTDFSIIEQALLTCDAPEHVWRPALDALRADRDDWKCREQETNLLLNRCVIALRQIANFPHAPDAYIVAGEALKF